MQGENAAVQNEATPQQKAPAQGQVVNEFSDNMAKMYFGETIKPSTPSTPVTPKDTTPETAKNDFDIKDPEDWFKEEFKDYGFENIEKAKQTMNEWKDKTTQQPQPKFENDFSKDVYNLILAGKTDDVIDTITKQRSVSSLLSSEVTKDNASDIIKLGLKIKYPTLTDKQIDFQYKQEYGSPKEPVFDDEKDIEEDFKKEHSEWKEKIENLEMKKVIAATMLKPDLEKYKSELILPKLDTANQHELSQEDQAKAKEFTDSFIKSASQSIKDFNGFSVTVKDKDVELPISYELSNEEKTFINEKMQLFADRNFDVNALFADVWLNEDGTINAKKVTEDLSRLYFAEKAYSKFANDGANKRLEEYLKQKKNISFNDTVPTNGFNQETRTISQVLADRYFG